MKDPREVVKAGDVVKVRVKEVDVARKRIALTMKSGAIQPAAPKSADPRGGGTQRTSAGSAGAFRGAQSQTSPAEPQGESALAAALRKAREQGKT